MAIFSDDKLNEVIGILKNQYSKSLSDDILIQYPMNAGDMLIPANTEVTPVNRRFNKKLKTITVSIPAKGIMTVENNNITQMFFSNESGTLEFPVGIYMEDVVIRLANTGDTPAQFSFRCIFSER